MAISHDVGTTLLHWSYASIVIYSNMLKQAIWLQLSPENEFLLFRKNVPSWVLNPGHALDPLVMTPHSMAKTWTGLAKFVFLYPFLILQIRSNIQLILLSSKKPEDAVNGHIANKEHTRNITVLVVSIDSFFLWSCSFSYNGIY